MIHACICIKINNWTYVIKDFSDVNCCCGLTSCNKQTSDLTSSVKKCWFSGASIYDSCQSTPCGSKLLQCMKCNTTHSNLDEKVTGQFFKDKMFFKGTKGTGRIISIENMHTRIFSKHSGTTKKVGEQLMNLQPFSDGTYIITSIQKKIQK